MLENFTCLLLFDEKDDEEDGEVPDTEQPVPPASPGMEVMLKEKNEANKRLPKNVKFNQSFDVGKQCADYLKHAPSATFDNYLECYKSFARFYGMECLQMLWNFL